MKPWSTLPGLGTHDGDAYERRDGFLAYWHAERRPWLTSRREKVSSIMVELANAEDLRARAMHPDVIDAFARWVLAEARRL